jgi:hypothetical protein
MEETGFFYELNGIDTTDIKAHLTELDQPFEQSELYVVAEEQNIIDMSQRQSRYRRLKSAELFELLEPVVARLNDNNPKLTFDLRRNDITQIRYEEGGFFGKHQDYLSVTSNMVQEFAMLVCITPDEHAKENQGGKTVLHMKSGKQQKYVSDATTTPGSALAFRKDLEHESTVLTTGEKHILMLNLWAWPKESDGVLLVEFNEAEAATKRPQAETDHALRELACGDRSYAISMSEAKSSSKLTECIESWQAREQNSSVLRYNCKGSYDEFGTIFRILRRMYVCQEEVEKRAELIKHYGLDRTHILLSVPEPTPELTELPLSKPLTDQLFEAGNASAGNASAGSAAGGVYVVRVHLLDGTTQEITAAVGDSVRSMKATLAKQTGLSPSVDIYAPEQEQPLRPNDTLLVCGCPAELYLVSSESSKPCTNLPQSLLTTIGSFYNHNLATLGDAKVATGRAC